LELLATFPSSKGMQESKLNQTPFIAVDEDIDPQNL
jgi:hypothetical protein